MGELEFTAAVFLMSRLSPSGVSRRGLLLEIGGISGLLPVTSRLTLGRRRCEREKRVADHTSRVAGRARKVSL